MMTAAISVITLYICKYDKSDLEERFRMFDHYQKWHLKSIAILGGTRRIRKTEQLFRLHQFTQSELH